MMLMMMMMGWDVLTFFLENRVCVSLYTVLSEESEENWTLKCDEGKKDTRSQFDTLYPYIGESGPIKT